MVFPIIDLVTDDHRVQPLLYGVDVLNLVGVRTGVFVGNRIILETGF